MKYLHNYIKFNEALKPSQFRPYVIEFDRTQYEYLFLKMKQKYSGDKNAYRIYIPLINDNISKNPIELEIKDFLEGNDFEIIDYVLGTCRRKGAKNPSKIGQVLTRLKKDDLMKKFVSDNSRKSGSTSDLVICISRHPYDIAGADSDRSWTNCMTLATPNSDRVVKMNSELSKLNSELKKLEMELYLGDSKVDRKIEDVKNKISALELKIKGYEEEGQNAYRLIQDVKHGTLICYLINKNDLNIQNPIANLNIKPYQNIKNKKDVILVSDTKMYGQGMLAFKQTVDNWLSEINGPTQDGLYCLKDGLYIDSHTLEYRILNSPKDKESLIKLLDTLNIENYKINDDLVVDVTGNVNISDKGIVKLPFKFGKIDGDFNASVNRFETLDNMPNIVYGNFNISSNLLKNLKGCPSMITGDLIATNNPIKDKTGIGEVSGNIEVDNLVKESVDIEKEVNFILNVKLDITNIPNQNQDIKTNLLQFEFEDLKSAKAELKKYKQKLQIDGYDITNIWIENKNAPYYQIKRVGKSIVNFITVPGFSYVILKTPMNMTFSVTIDGKFQGDSTCGIPHDEYYLKAHSPEYFTYENFKNSEILSGEKLNKLECAFQTEVNKILCDDANRKDKELKDTYNNLFKRYKKC